MADVARAAERVWYGHGAGPATARTVLAPLAAVYGAVVGARGALYDRRILRSHELALPALSVGNLSVGGTGKTPVAAWVAGAMAAAGARPAVVLRGYGGDEPLVHAALTPGVVVVADPDRVRGVATARARGATAAILDDGFQHRRAGRRADVVLVSADRWTGAVRLLPAGPFREGLAALARASVVVVTRKAAGDACVEATLAALRARAAAVPTAVIRLELGELRAWAGGAAARPLAALRGEALLAISAVGDPAAFEAQLGALGARVRPRRFRDHHAFTAGDAAALAREAAAARATPVCTLKDAVKLGPLWPSSAHPLWYVSQRVAVERGADELARAIGAALR